MSTFGTTDIQRQDFVDNAIFDLIQQLNPTEKNIDWNIEAIGNVRDVIKHYFCDADICTETEFYP